MPEQPQQYLKGARLRADRKKTSRTIVYNIKDWKFRTNVVDYRGYDVKRTKIPSETRNSLEGMFEDQEDIDRIVRHTKDHSQTKIRDFETFKKAFSEAWEGTKNADNLFGALSGQEDLMMRLFADPEVQSIVTQNGEPEGARKLQQRYPQLTPYKARQLYRQKRRHEIQLISQGWIPSTQLKMPMLVRAPTEASSRLTLRQRTRDGGIIYARAKPKPFNLPQERFLRNNPDVPTAKLTSQFNIVFGQSRTQQSVYFKRYRLLRG